ncbi:superoxide dismutase family protein [Lactonifactor longoviformis]
MNQKETSMRQSRNYMFSDVLLGTPDAVAKVKGDENHRGLVGYVYFYGSAGGSLVLAEIEGLPYEDQKCPNGIFGFHIHEGNTCTGTPEDPFADTKNHWNPEGCEHPEHAGDMPSLFGNRGFAWMMFYTDRFYPEEVVGKTVVIHDMPDDFRSQPSGDSGRKIACGEII